MQGLSDRDADTGPDEDRAPVDLIGLTHNADDAARDGLDIGLLSCVDQDKGELVAAHARDRVLAADYALQALGDQLAEACRRRDGQEYR